MRSILIIAGSFLLLSASANADARKAFYGTWGTAKQCAREPIKSGGTVLSEPFEITPQWMRQGKLWCNLNWGPIETRKNELFTAANAQCGEDSVRGYFLGFELSGRNLKLRWDIHRSSKVLARCSGS